MQHPATRILDTQSPTAPPLPSPCRAFCLVAIQIRSVALHGVVVGKLLLVGDWIIRAVSATAILMLRG